MEIEGRFLGHSSVSGFLFEYTCSRCHRPFIQRETPTISAPALCHWCYTGGKKGRKGKVNKSQKPNRRSKHKHPGESN